MARKNPKVAVKAAKKIEVKKEDKLQNEALEGVIKKVDKLTKIVYSKTQSNQTTDAKNLVKIPVDASVGTIVPALSQGLGEGERTGDNVLASLTVKYALNSLAADDTTNPIACARVVRVMIGYCKDHPGTPPVDADFADLLRTDSTAANWTGSSTDEFKPVNMEKFAIVHDKKYLIGPSIGASQAAGVQTVNSFNSSNGAKNHATGFKQLFKNKRLTFNDTVSNFPQNAFYYIWAMSYRVDGGSDGTTIVPITLSFLADLTYKTY